MNGRRTRLRWDGRCDGPARVALCRAQGGSLRGGVGFGVYLVEDPKEEDGAGSNAKRDWAGPGGRTWYTAGGRDGSGGDTAAIRSGARGQAWVRSGINHGGDWPAR